VKNNSHILILIVFTTLSCSLWEYDDPYFFIDNDSDGEKKVAIQ
jgi:hypothetical protein